MTKQETRDRAWNFYTASMMELIEINNIYGYNLPMPDKIIFGHTHCPVKWGDINAAHTAPLGITDMKPIIYYNTGGWLSREISGGTDFPGAEIFFYKTGQGFSS